MCNYFISQYPHQCSWISLNTWTKPYIPNPAIHHSVYNGIKHTLSVSLPLSRSQTLPSWTLKYTRIRTHTYAACTKVHVVCCTSIQIARSHTHAHTNPTLRDHGARVEMSILDKGAFRRKENLHTYVHNGNFNALASGKENLPTPELAIHLYRT